MQITRDLAHGARLLLKHRGFTAAAVATLSLGIGITTAVLTIVDTVVFRPLPYGDPSRLVKICGNARAIATDDVALLDYLDIREQNTVFESMAADDGSGYTVEHGGVREAAAGAIVTHDWLTTLRVRPLFGRAFTAEESEPGRDTVVLLTHSYWRRRFGSDPQVVGTQLRVDGQPHTIVGVVPPNVFRYGADFLKPLVPASYNRDRAYVNLDVFARLRPGATIGQAAAELATIGSRLQLAYPATNRNRGFSVLPLDRYYASIEPGTAQGLLLVFGAVVLLLAIACANVANLVLTRMLARYRECVVRVALGATRPRILRLFIAENLLLFAAGGVGGAAIARWLLDALVGFAVQEGYVPPRMAVALDARILAISLLASLALGVAVGAAVAVNVSRVNVSDGLRESTHTSPGGRARRRIRHALVIGELVLSLVLLFGFSLMTRSFFRLHANALGFDPAALLETTAEGGRSLPAAIGFWRAAMAQAESMPGVRLAAVTSRPPVRGARQRVIDVDGPVGAIGPDPAVGDISISASYFRTMGIPLLRGRGFDDRDSAGAPPVVIVSETLARRYFPNVDPVGRRLMIREREPLTCCATAGPVAGIWREIVGVAGDVRQSRLEDELTAMIYRPVTQIAEHDMFLMVRADSPAALPGVASSLRARLPPPPDGIWTEPRLTREVIDGSDSLRRRRFMLTLLGAFAVLAVALAAAGLYGVVAGSIAERRRELAVRVALGATPRVIATHVLVESLQLWLVALPVGAAAAYVFSRFVGSLLYGVSPADAPSFVIVTLFLIVLTLVASYLPARRAARTDPLSALRGL